MKIRIVSRIHWDIHATTSLQLCKTWSLHQKIPYMLRNLEKSPSKEHNITLVRNYSNAIGSSKRVNEKTEHSIFPKIQKWQTFLFTTESFHIILRDIRWWEQLTRLEFVFVKNKNWTQIFIFHFSILKKKLKLNIDFHFSMFRKNEIGTQTSISHFHFFMFRKKWKLYTDFFSSFFYI